MYPNFVLRANTEDTEEIKPRNNRPKNILPDEVTVALLYKTLNIIAAYNTVAAKTK